MNLIESGHSTNASQQKIVSHLAANPGSTIRQIVAATCLTHVTAQNTAKELVELGWLSREKVGRSYRYSNT